eukprot:1846917-Rhodomonas_salina.1
MAGRGGEDDVHADPLAHRLALRRAQRARVRSPLLPHPPFLPNPEPRTLKHRSVLACSVRVSQEHARLARPQP